MIPREPAARSRVERRKEETKLKIVTVAVGLFKEQGIDETTMEQVAEVADIAKGTLYNYFPSKEAIISEYVQQAFQKRKTGRFKELEALPDTRTRVTLIFTELMKGVQEQKELFERYLTFRMQTMVAFHRKAREASGFNLLVKKIVELGQETGDIRTDLPLGLLEDFLEFAFIESVKPLYTEPERYDAHESIARCVDLFMNGVKPSR